MELHFTRNQLAGHYYFLQRFFFYQWWTRLHFGLVQRLINYYNNGNNILIQHAIYLWVNASITPNHTKVLIFPSRGPRRHLRHCDVALHDHVLVVVRACKHAFANVCRPLACVTCVACVALFHRSSPMSSLPASTRAARWLGCRPSLASLSAPSSLAARVSASLERRSPVDSGRRGRLSSNVCSARCVWLHTIACGFQCTANALARHHVHWRSHIPV